MFDIRIHLIIIFQIIIIINISIPISFEWNETSNIFERVKLEMNIIMFENTWNNLSNEIEIRVQRVSCVDNFEYVCIMGHRSPIVYNEIIMF